MWWMSLVVSAVSSAADPCETPRVRDTAPLVAAMAQDKVLGLAFTKAAGVCAERGDACDQARLECTTLLTQTTQKQAAFDEGQWLRDMLLPYVGGSYPMSRQFGAATLASDTSCNVELAALEQAAQRRQAQSARREALYQEYQQYTRWAQTQFQKCKDTAAANEVKNAQSKAEAERLAALAVAATAAEQLKAKQAQDAAAAKAEADRRAREFAEAEAKKQQDARERAEREAKDRKNAEQRARDERDADRKAAEARLQKQEEDRKQERLEAEALRMKEKAAAEDKAKADKEEAERKQAEAVEKRAVSERDARVAQQRATKAQLVSEAEAALKHAQEQEALKKQLAVDAVSSSPAIAQAAVAEAATAERARVEAEKRLVDAKAKADSIVIDDSFERSSGSAILAGGASAVDNGFGVFGMAAFHFGFWGTAPSDGMASGLELRLWGRYFATVTQPTEQNFDSLLTARYYFGPIGLGVGGEIRAFDANFASLRGGVGPSLAAAFIDNHTTRVVLSVSYLPLGNTIDVVRLVGDLEVSWKFLSFQVLGGSYNHTLPDGTMGIGWRIGGAVGLRASW